MTNTSYRIKHVEDNTIYMSHYENSFAHRVYQNMRETFWQNELQICKENDVNHNMYSDNESNNMIPSEEEPAPQQADGSYAASNNVNVNDTHHEGATSRAIKTEKEVKLDSQVIPMRMDISTQFNSDMKIVIKQDSNDSSVINIRFDGPIHGNVEGMGNMSKSSFKALMQDKAVQQNTKEYVKSPEKEVKDRGTNIELKVNDVNTTMKPTKKSSFGSEESINYFASTLPNEAVSKNEMDKNTGTVIGNMMKSSEIVSNTNVTSEQYPLSDNVGSDRGTFAEYKAPYSQQTMDVSNLASVGAASSTNRRGETPAVLPKCIIRRIARAMVSDLSIKRKSNSKIFDLERKINMLKFDENILNQNWHAAIKRGNMMIGEIMELIITVNIDKTQKTIDEIHAVLEDLKSELVNSTFYLLSMTDVSLINETLCLQLIIDIVCAEIDKLKLLAEEWIRSGYKPDFSTFFIKKFSETVSPITSEMIGNDSQSIEKSGYDDTMPPRGNMTQTKSKSESINLPNSVTGTVTQGTLTHPTAIHDRSTQSSMDKNGVMSRQPTLYNDPSIITNSRIIKTMKGIMQSALDENLSYRNLTKTYRNNALAIEIINDKPLMKVDSSMSLIKELVALEKKWNIPILTGKTSIQDLIEFIINTLSQSKESDKNLYDEVVEELNQLEKELMFSVTNNLYISRHSDLDLMTLSYELLAEIILEEFAIAKYIFKELDRDNITSESYPLGKLYRNYISQPMKIPDNAIHGGGSKESKNYASEELLKNYSDGSVTSMLQEKRLKTASTQDIEHENVRPVINFFDSEHISAEKDNIRHNTTLSSRQSEPNKIKSEMSEPLSQDNDNIRHNTTLSSNHSGPNKINSVDSEHFSRENDTIKHNTTLSSLHEGPNKINSADSEHFSRENDIIKHNTTLSSIQSEHNKINDSHVPANDLQNIQGKMSKDESAALLLIIDKLNNQTMEINKIKDNLQNLAGKVDEKFGQWTCKFSLDKVNDYCQANDPVHYADAKKMFNTQEVINPGNVSATIVQPSVHKPVADLYSRANTAESASFIAPISNNTVEQSVDHINRQAMESETLNSDDVLNLIAAGSHNLLINASKSPGNENLPRRDSCREMNIEFDKVFHWVVDKYEGDLNNLQHTPDGSQFVKNMQSLPEVEKRKIERELINKIIDSNNIMIHSWMKEICYKRLLNCLTRPTSQ